MNRKISFLAKIFIFFLVLLGATANVIAETPLDLSPETIRRAIRNTERAEVNQTPSHVARFRVVTFSSTDETACRAMREQLLKTRTRPARTLNPQDSAQNLCKENQQKSLVSVVLMDEVDSIEFQRRIGSGVPSSDKNLVTDTRNVALGMGAMMGVLWLMPTSVTKWDKDDPAINYVGHPLAGAATYTLARHNGISPLESFGYSFVMSTFFWEYGVEAFAEKPSYQDLIVTPIVGAVLGEAFYRLEKRIIANGGTLLDSKELGSAAMVVLNPAGSLSDAINEVAGSRLLQDSRASVFARRMRDSMGLQSNVVGVQLQFTFSEN